MAAAHIGQRVVLSDSWSGSGSGHHVGVDHVGTIVRVGSKHHLNDKDIPSGYVNVLWDCGYSNNYQAGYHDAYDLLLLDNGPTGITHSGSKCERCSESPITGMRWRCVEESCPNYHLCTTCYMTDEHDVNHSFIRFSTGSETGIPVTPRLAEKKTLSTGLFAGATVEPGGDWQGEERDVGQGTVTEICGMSGRPRSAVTVRWSETGSVSRCRVGYEGKVDLKSVEDANGVTFYSSHLPLLGKEDGLRNGESVAITIDTETLKEIQLSSGRQWTNAMGQVFGKVAKINNITLEGEVEVSYSDGVVFIFSPEVLTKVPKFGKGDRVRVVEDLAFVMTLQETIRNGWLDGMEHCRGVEGNVLKVDSSQNVRVKLDNISDVLSWHPCTLTLLKKNYSEDESPYTIEIEVGEDTSLTDLLLAMQLKMGSSFLDSSTDGENTELIHAAKMGKVERVVEILSQYPEMVNSKARGKSALHEAALQGHLNVLQALVEMGANLDIADIMGNTPLHLAVMGDEPAALKYLLGKRADPDRGNTNCRSALHMAAAQGHVDCARVLIQHGCNVNLLDSNCNTPLHLAIYKSKMEMVELLLQAPEISMALTNDRHLNPIQFAALLDRPKMVKLIGQVFPVLTAIPTAQSGHSLLHIAAVNDHVDVLKEILAVKDNSLHLDTKNDKSETALHLGTKSGKTESVEFLVSRGANINSVDNDGNTALHLLAMIKAKDASRVNHSQSLRKIQRRYKHEGCDDNASTLMCFLVQHGASVDIQNQDCRTPLSYISKYAKLKDTLKKISRGESDGMNKVSSWEEVVEEKDSKYSRLKDNVLDKDKQPVSVTAKPDIKDLPLVHHINVSELDMGPVIGKGQFGVVHRATWRGTSVAVKKISILGSKLSEVEKEVAIHRRASHPNIVQIMAHGYDGTYDAYIVMQLIEGSSLNDIIFSSNSVKMISLNRDQKVLISRAVLQAVTFLHGCNILHLDIKPSNILIETATTRPYLCDLGLAHIKNRHAMSQSSFTVRGTPGYMPPEALGQLGSSRGHSDKHDVWSVAGTLVELFSEKRLWGDSLHPFALIAQLMTGTVGKPESLEAVEHGVRIILDQCFNRDPGKRPAAKKLLDQFNTLK